MPQNKKVTYTQFVCDLRALNPEHIRLCCLVGGDKLDCDIDSGAPTTDITEFQLFINSVISEAKKGARFHTCHLKEIFLASSMQN